MPVKDNPQANKTAKQVNLSLKEIEISSEKYITFEAVVYL
jgi:hypothetical protein